MVDAAYAFMVNTAALKAAGIGPDTPSPPGGAIVKDGQGVPTGLLRNVGGLLDRYRAAGRPEQLLAALEEVHRHYNAVGITSVIERAADLAGYRAYAQLHEQGRQRVRATVTLRVDSDGSVEGTEAFIRSLALRFGDGDDWLRVGPLKIFADGGILAGTAFMREPYGPGRGVARTASTDPVVPRVPHLPAEKIRNMIAHRTPDGLADVLARHGRRGRGRWSSTLEAADRDRPITRPPLHADPRLLPQPRRRPPRRRARRVRRHPARLVLQGRRRAPARAGEPARSSISSASRTGSRAGVKVALNTDHMFGVDPDRSLNPYNPFLTMGTAVTRRTEGGQVIGPEQAVSREDALRMMTSNAA